jgi:hypothetical protein
MADDPKNRLQPRAHIPSPRRTLHNQLRWLAVVKANPHLKQQLLGLQALELPDQRAEDRPRHGER